MPGDDGAVVGGDAQEGAAAAADVEHGLAGARWPARWIASLVGRALLRLGLAPVAGAQAPRVRRCAPRCVGVVVDIRWNSLDRVSYGS